jgi:hypothetical protein
MINKGALVRLKPNTGLFLWGGHRHHPGRTVSGKQARASPDLKRFAKNLNHNFFKAAGYNTD